MENIRISSNIKSTSYKGDSFLYIETIIIKGKSKWSIVDSGGDSISVTKTVNGKRSAISSPLGKIFFDWFEMAEHYKSIRPNLISDVYRLHMSKRVELQYSKILNPIEE